MQTKHPLVVEPIGLDLQTLSRPLDFPTLFGNSKPVEIEIGSGKGTFLLEQARARPEVNFIGVEWANWYWRYASDRLRRAQLLNARTVRAEAAFFLREFIPPASISAVHIYFPDPWPKARHHKRRLIQPPFLDLVARVLAPGGQLQIVTDHTDYFEQITAAIIASPLRPIDYRPPPTAADGEYVGTNFERKYRRAGRPFHAIAAQRIA
jgi:tRNA (guanine-N7-)-methyltransferase